MTSLSRTFQSTPECSTDNISSLIPSQSDNIRNGFQSSYKNKDRDLSEFLEIPGSTQDTYNTEPTQKPNRELPGLDIPPTPLMKEERSIESIFKVLNGKSDDFLSQTEDSETSIALKMVPEKDLKKKVVATPSSSNFEFFDESLFSPSPPKPLASSGLSVNSEDQTSSFSLDGFIENKIDEITRNVPEHFLKIKFNEVYDYSNSSRVVTSSSNYETVDYFDIFGDEECVEETFSPTVIQLSTQPGNSTQPSSSIHPTNITQPATGVGDQCNFDESEEVLDDGFHGNGVRDEAGGDEVFEVEIPSCGMWDVGEEVELEFNNEIIINEEVELERQSKRRKLGNIFRNPRLVTFFIVEFYRVNLLF